MARRAYSRAGHRCYHPQLEIVTMRKLFGGMVVAALPLSLTTAAHAQRRTASAPMGGAKHELGVDGGLAYIKPSQLDGGFGPLSPPHLRFGIVPRRGQLMM